MIVISGQKIARQIGVSRSAVWRWTQRLRALGVRVKGHPRTGYRIERVPDVLSPSLLRRRLRDTPFGKRIHHFFKTARPTASLSNWGTPASRTGPLSSRKSRLVAGAGLADPGIRKRPAAFT